MMSCLHLIQYKIISVTHIVKLAIYDHVQFLIYIYPAIAPPALSIYVHVNN